MLVVPILTFYIAFRATRESLLDVLALQEVAFVVPGERDCR